MGALVREVLLFVLVIAWLLGGLFVIIHFVVKYW
jgi:hypothetical protein